MPPRVLHYSDLENVYDTPDRVARLAGLLDARRDAETLVAGSGDDTAPGVLSLVSDGRQSLDFFETVSPHVDTVGNHDLDNGVDALADIVADSPQQWVLSNVTVDGDPLLAGAGVEPTTTVGLDGSTVGIVGVLSPETPSMTPGTDHLDFADPVDTVERDERELREAGAGYVLALAHTSDEDAEAIARETGVDAVLAGHSHEPRTAVLDGTVLSRPGATGRSVAELDLGRGDVRLHETADAASDGTADADPDERVRAALDARMAEAGLNEVVDRVDEPLARDRAARRAGEWRLGNLVADAYRWKTGADAALQNAGGLREGPPLSGAVTVGDLVGVSPFDEPVVVAAVSGRELEAIAREADGRRVDGLPDRWWGHVSGLRIGLDGRAGGTGGNASAPAADDYDVTVCGDPVDPGRQYTLAVPAFLLKTDREFPTLTEDHLVERFDPQYDVIVEYARERGIDPSLAGRVPDLSGDASPDRDAVSGDRGAAPGDDA